MRKWKKPIITRVKLDPSQAVLAPCKTGGEYMAEVSISVAGTAKCLYGDVAPTGFSCTANPKGTTAGGPGTTKFTGVNQTDLQS